VLGIDLVYVAITFRCIVTRGIPTVAGVP